MSPRRPSAAAQSSRTLDLDAIRAGLEADVARLRSQLGITEDDLANLRGARFRDGGDEVEVGAETLEADRHSVIAWNTRQTLRQSQRALARLRAGTYGTCETCQCRIDPRRLQAYPRATLCLTCQQTQPPHH